MKLIIISIFTVLFSIIGSVLAADSVYTSKKVINKYNIGTTGVLLIFQSSTSADPIKNPAGCSSSTSYAIDANNPHFNKFYSAVLASYYSDQKIGFLISGNTCTLNRPTVISIQAD